MINRLFILLITIAFIGSVNAQYDSLSKKEFEGVITYRVNYELDSKVSTEGEELGYGTEWKFYYKQGKYKIEMDAVPIKKIIYLSEKNTQYFFDEEKMIDSIICDKDKRKVKKSNLIASEEKILGRNCMKLTQKYSDGEIHVIESDTNIYINPDYYAKHQLTLLNQSMYLLPSQFLRYVYTVKNVSTLTLTATKVEEISIDDNIFKLSND